MQRWRKLLMAGGALAALLASPAFADGEITASTLQNKTITVTETINFDVQVDSELTVVLAPQKFAESLAVANQSNFGNKACENCAEKQDIIIDSANDNTGILSINQASGNANNQGTLFSAAVDVALPGFDDPPPPDAPPPVEGEFGFAEASAAVDQRNGTSSATGLEGEGNIVDTVNILFRDAAISGSFNGNTGLVFANQSAGNFANQVNVLSLAFSLAPSGVALAEADLGQINAQNQVMESDTEVDDDAPAAVGIVKAAALTGSFNGNVGVFAANQSVGNMSNQANVLSIAAVGASLPTF